MRNDEGPGKADSRRVFAQAESPPVSYRYSAAEKLKLFIPGLRQKLVPKKNLFAGPFTGEFGYELMQWQGYVRARRNFYDTVHVLTYPGRDYLYEDCHVHHHQVDLKLAGYGYGLMGREEARAAAMRVASEIGLSNYDIFEPSLLCTRYHKALWKQSFRLLQEPAATAETRDVVFHFRAVQKEGYDHFKNYPPSLADELVDRCRAKGMSVGCIGHPDYSYCPSQAEDLREIDLKKTVAAISVAHAVAGENSGPMHLANLCGKPTILWAQDQWRIDYSLRWNPFRVPIYVAANDTCQPAPERVCQTIADALRDLETRSAGFTKPLYSLPAQPIARF